MLKKFIFLVVLSISNLQAEAPKVRFIDRISRRMHAMAEQVKNSHAWSLWLGSIIPAIVAHVSSECVIRAYKEDSAYKRTVTIATGVKWASFIMCLFSFNEWWLTDFRPWFKGLFKIKTRPKPMVEPVTP